MPLHRRLARTSSSELQPPERAAAMAGDGKSRKRRSSDSPSPAPAEDERRKKHRKRDDRERKISKDDDKEAKKKKGEKSHKRSKSHDRKEKKSREKHRSHKKDIQELSKDDYYSKNNEFSMWLKEEKGIHFLDLSSEDARDLFARFIKDWNRQKLESRYYEGVASAPRTAHDWALKL